MTWSEQSEWLDVLLGTRNADGGTPYTRASQSALEPTSLTILALRHFATQPGIEKWQAAGCDYLLSQRSSNGRWQVTVNDPSPAWETPLALMALAENRRHLPICRESLKVLLESRADPGNPEGVRLNPRWRGWNWHPSSPGWVEPTSLALLAAERLGALADPTLLAERLRDGKEFLRDRWTSSGGWNYGNSYVLGIELKPFLAPTAMALLALKSGSSDEARMQRGLDLLERGLRAQPSGWSLSWGILALVAFGRPVEDFRALLQESWRKARFLNNCATLALALLAMNSTAENHPFHSGV